MGLNYNNDKFHTDLQLSSGYVSIYDLKPPLLKVSPFVDFFYGILSNELLLKVMILFYDLQILVVVFIQNWFLEYIHSVLVFFGVCCFEFIGFHMIDLVLNMLRLVFL